VTTSARNNHTIQNLDDGLVHDWYRFVLAYPDHLVQDMIQKFAITRKHTVLDPFVGTGTTLVECKKQGIRSIGIDANPVTAFASEVKTHWDIDVEEFSARCQSLIEKIRHSTGESVYVSAITLASGNQLSFESTEDVLLPEPDTVHSDLLNIIPLDAFSPRPLQKVLIARDMIEAEPDDPITDIFRLALASIAVRNMSNLGFGPEVYVKRNKLIDADLFTPLSKYLANVKRDLLRVQQLTEPGSSQVVYGDARNLASLIDEPVDFVITSPPYPNEKDYTRITRLELALLKFITDKASLRTLKEQMLRSHTRNIYKDDHDADRVQDIPEIVDLAHSIEDRRIEKNATSGFEKLYHRVVLEYFGGMHRVFEQLYHVMPSGSKLAIVVGDQKSYFQIPIYTAHLLSLVAQRLDFREIEIFTWRTRLATAIKEDIDERILILERR
jgi:hypothetical protein